MHLKVACQCIYIFQRMTSIRLKFPCPGSFEGNCPNRGNISWIHHLCTGKLRLTRTGDIFCLKCGDIGFIQSWKFNCGYHGGIFIPFTELSAVYHAIGNATKAAAVFFEKEPNGAKSMQEFSSALIININAKWNYALAAKDKMQFHLQ